MTTVIAAVIGAALLFVLAMVGRGRKGATGGGEVRVIGEVPEPADATPGWTTTEILTLIRDTSRAEQFRWPEVARAIAFVESSYRWNAIGDDGASIGVMQLKLNTAAHYVPTISDRDDLLDAERNILAGVRFLKDLDRKHFGTHGLAGVIMMYNLGETQFAAGARVPGYLAKVRAQLPPEFAVYFG